jgi:hypothetical protein
VQNLAITYNEVDFDDSLTILTDHLHLGEMAYGLRIEGVCYVIWTFSNGKHADVSVRSMVYNVTKENTRLLIPQELFDFSTGMKGQYEGDQTSFRLI